MLRLPFIRAIRPWLPRPVYLGLGGLHRQYVRLYCRWVGLGDSRAIQQAGISAPVPPAPLRYRVHGSPSLDSFIRQGQRIVADLAAALERHGYDLAGFEHVLDFGCGCGRTLIWLPPRLGAEAQIDGVDIDHESIEWCQSHLSLARCAVNEPLPPLRYADGTFDLLYAISVFSHLDADYQAQWLQEWQRVLRPGGLALVSVLNFEDFKPESVQPQDLLAYDPQQGFAFQRSHKWTGIFPGWYQTAFLSEQYARSAYSPYFDVLDFIRRGINQSQDLVVLRRR